MKKKPATIAKAFKGKFSNWKVGTKVMAWRCQKEWMIERVRWINPNVHIANQCYGVPKSYLLFDK